LANRVDDHLRLPVAAPEGVWDDLPKLMATILISLRQPASYLNFKKFQINNVNSK
jgi:hypothetical protein